MMSKLFILMTILSTVLCQNEPDINSYRYYEKLVNLQSVCDNIPNEVTDGCKEQFIEICKNKTLLFSIYDANSKFPYTGLNEVARTDLGNYDECLAVDHKYDKGRILGKYCNSGLLIPDPVNIWNFLNYFKLSVCKPDNCSVNDYKVMFNYSLYIDVSCETKENLPEITTYDVITICVISVFIALMSLSTLYDMLLRKNSQKPHHPLLLAFSIQSNWEKLTKTTDGSNREQVLVLNGLKVFSMLWVHYGHSSGGWYYVPIINPSAITMFSNDIYKFYIFSSYYAVDTFFFISGFLMAWSYMKMKYLPLKTHILNVPIGYLHRYLRLTPALVALLIVEMSIYKHMGSGPLWNTMYESADKPCRENWWTVLLYIQNYYNNDGVCMVHSWYLSADMQMFVLAPLVVIPLAILLRNKKWFLPCMVVMFLLNCILTGIPIWIKMENRDTINNYATHSRLVDYCMGIMLATFMREFKEEPFLGKKLSEKSKWYLNIAIWCIILAGMTGLLIGTRQVELNSKYEGYWTFDMMKRFIWSIILSWIVYSCYFGYGGVINYILSTPLMQIGGKLSYSFYLLHYPLIMQNISSSRTMGYLSDYNLFLSFASIFVVSALAAIFWALAFESPFIVIQSFLLRRVSVKKT